MICPMTHVLSGMVGVASDNQDRTVEHKRIPWRITKTTRRGEDKQDQAKVTIWIINDKVISFYGY